jgi:hypothetical protein
MWFPLVARNVSERVQRRPEWAPVNYADEVELKARPLCAGVSVEPTMRSLRDKVDEYLKRVNAPNALAYRPACSASCLRMIFSENRFPLFGITRYPVASFFMRHI